MEYFGEASRFPGGRCPLGCDNCERAQHHGGSPGQPAVLTGFDWTEWAEQVGLTVSTGVLRTSTCAFVTCLKDFQLLVEYKRAG